MFSKHLAKLSVLILISFFIVNPIYINAGSQQTAEDYEKYIASSRREIAELGINLMVKTPMREGRDRIGTASGVAILEMQNEVKDVFGKSIKYRTYYILTSTHVVSEKENDLENYKQDGVRILVLGKGNYQASAEIVAWEWGSDILTLKVDIAENELDNFKIKIAKIAKELPISAFDAKYTGQDVPTIYLGGYPARLPIANPGYVSQYFLDYDFNDYTHFVKIFAIDVQGLNGAGQSGAGAFNRDKELIGIIFASGSQYLGSNLALAIPIDVIVERFLKQLPEFKNLGLPQFELEKQIKNKPIFLGRPKIHTIY